MHYFLPPFAVIASLAIHAFAADSVVTEQPNAVTRVPVTFSGGHVTEPVDRGRPVNLIAAALGVKSEVFRDAFSHVHPAGPGSGGPTPEEARKNKTALMGALSKFGVTNDRLDEVSNFYRYRPGKDQLWRNKPATANAFVQNGKVIGFEITSGGAGYSSAPTIALPNNKSFRAKAELTYGKDLTINGAVSSITVSP